MIGLQVGDVFRIFDEDELIIGDDGFTMWKAVSTPFRQDDELRINCIGIEK